ncbi:MAG: hypothetical protein IPM79_03020 [Polyangiaceae bacterium]|nr:hypothetical protein [Polyangiaceae bacterium]
MENRTRPRTPVQLTCGGWFAGLAVLGLLSLGLPACGGGEKAPSTASASASPEPPALAASSAPVLGPDPAPAGDPVGAGYSSVISAKSDKSGCNAADFQVAEYLMRGELTVAGRPRAGSASDKKPEFTASWLVKLKDNRSQIGFAGYDHLARRVARDRGIGNAKEHAPKLFATDDQWTVVWFDDEGLAYAHPTFDPNEKPSIEHLGAAKGVDPNEVAFNHTPDGSLIVASHVGTQGDQLSVFLFAPSAQGQTARAIGLTKAAKKPRFPAVTADEAGYTLAWLEEDQRIVSTRLDTKGDQQGSGATIAGPSEKRSSLALTQVKGGSLLTWAEGDRILARKLDASAKATGDIVVVGSGKHPVVISSGDDAIVTFLAKVEDSESQMIAVRVSGAAVVSPQAVRISDGNKPVLDPPAIALGGSRLAGAWTEVMGATISSKRAWLRVIDAACLK